MNEQSKELRRKFADMFAEALNGEPKKWRKEWFSARSCFNAATNSEYTGFNRFMLAHLSEVNGWTDPRFMTFAQASKKNLSIIKGSKGSDVEFWSPYDYKRKKKLSWSDVNAMPESERENVGLISRTYKVFNGSQIKGLEPYRDERATNVKANAAVLKMADSMGIKVIHGGSNAYYSLNGDEVHIPPPDHFASEEAYASTLAHELAHASGAKHRLDRNMSGQFGSDDYAREELTAEITACYICSELGIEMTDDHIENHQAYVQSWGKVVKEDPKALTDAIKSADEGTDFLMVHAGLMTKSEFEKKHRKELPGRIKADEEQLKKIMTQRDDETQEEFIARMTRELPDAGVEVFEAQNYVYVPPHTRGGKKVRGYYRRVRS